MNLFDKIDSMNPVYQISAFIITVIVVLIIVAVLVIITSNPLLKYKEYWSNKDLLSKLSGNYDIPTQIALKRLSSSIQNEENLWRVIDIIKNCLFNENIKSIFEKLLSKMTKCVKMWCHIILDDHTNVKKYDKFVECQFKLDDLIIFYNYMGSDVEYLFSIKNQLFNEFKKQKSDNKIEQILDICSWMRIYNDNENSANYQKQLYKIDYSELLLPSYTDILAECCEYTEDLTVIKKILEDFKSDVNVSNLFRYVWSITKDKKIILEYISEMVRPSIFGIEYTCCKNAKIANLEQLISIAQGESQLHSIDISIEICKIVNNIENELMKLSENSELPNLTKIKTIISTEFDKFTLDSSSIKNRILMFNKEILMNFIY